MKATDLLMGGPGLDGYAYQATLYCVECGRKRIAHLVRWVKVQAALDADDTLYLYDSENMPQPVFFGESDGPEHCDDCGEYLYGLETE